jgi:vacuolar-type H+-ATPase subunit H
MGVATSIAIASIAITAAGTAKSFSDASKEKKLQKQAQSDADAAMAEARKKLETNYYDQLAVKKEPYELEREAMLSQGAQAIQAAQESERGAAATAGRVQMAMNEGQAAIRTAMGKEMTDIDKMKLAEDARLRDLGVNLDLAEVQGAQLAARDAQQASAAATRQGIQGLTSMGQQGLSLVPLYPKTGAESTSEVPFYLNPNSANPPQAPQIPQTPPMPQAPVSLNPFEYNPMSPSPNYGWGKF